MFEKFKRKPTEQDLQVREVYKKALLEARKKEARRVAEAHAKQEADAKISKESGGGLKGALSSFNTAREKFVKHMDNMPDLIGGSYFNDKEVSHATKKEKTKKEMI